MLECLFTDVCATLNTNRHDAKRGKCTFSYSETSFMSDLNQNIWKTRKVRYRLKIDTWLIT